MGKDQRGFTITGTTCSSGTVDAGADQTNYLTVNGSSETLAGAITSGNTAGSEDVDFASSLDGTSLTLSSALPTITGQISIIGPGAAKLEIAGPANSTVLQVNASAEAAIYGLTFGSSLTNAGTLTLAASAIASAGLEAGIGAGGGGLNNSGTAFITDSTFAGDQVSGNATAAGKGGAIYNTGALSLTGATLSGDAVTDASGAGSAEGGAIYNGSGGTLTISDSTIAGNNQSGTQASDAGGGIFNDGGTVTLSNTIVAANTSSGDDADGAGHLPTAVTI